MNLLDSLLAIKRGRYSEAQKLEARKQGPCEESKSSIQSTRKRVMACTNCGFPKMAGVDACCPHCLY